jgi:hypothetical protein
MENAYLKVNLSGGCCGTDTVKDVLAEDNMETGYGLGWVRTRRESKGLHSLL